MFSCGYRCGTRAGAGLGPDIHGGAQAIVTMLKPMLVRKMQKPGSMVSKAGCRSRRAGVEHQSPFAIRRLGADAEKEDRRPGSSIR